MSDRPSDGMRFDELRDEFDWMFEFQSRMADRIRGDADVHSLVDYVGKLESENASLQELCKKLLDLCYDAYEQKWGWDDDWALAYEQAKKLGIEVAE